jgi:hypothetical protein
MKPLRSALLLGVLVLHLSAFGADPTSAITGRMSDTLATVTIRTELDAPKTPVLLLYFLGAPGWNLGLPHSRIESGSNSQGGILVQLEIGGRELSAELTSDVQTVYVMGKKFDLGASNVFLVRDADGASPKVEALGRADLGSKTDESSLPEAVARAYPSIAEAVGLDR